MQQLLNPQAAPEEAPQGEAARHTAKKPLLATSRESPSAGSNEGPAQPKIDNKNKQTNKKSEMMARDLQKNLSSQFLQPSHSYTLEYSDITHDCYICYQ